MLGADKVTKNLGALLAKKSPGKCSHTEPVGTKSQGEFLSEKLEI